MNTTGIDANFPQEPIFIFCASLVSVKLLVPRCIKRLFILLPLSLLSRRQPWHKMFQRARQNSLNLARRV